MTLFLSTILNKMDSKCRVSIPSNFRSSLKNQSFKGIIAFLSYNDQSIDACGIERMEKISNSLDTDTYSRDEFDLISMYFGEAEQLPFDKDGRVTLPKKLIIHAKIESNVMFVGLGPTFQMWNPESYELKKDRMMQNAKNKKINPRLKPIPKGM